MTYNTNNKPEQGLHTETNTVQQTPSHAVQQTIPFALGKVKHKHKQQSPAEVWVGLRGVPLRSQVIYLLPIRSREGRY